MVIQAADINDHIGRFGGGHRLGDQIGNVQRRRHRFGSGRIHPSRTARRIVTLGINKLHVARRDGC